MAELTGRERLQPSLLDRLTDNAPEQRRETLEQQTLSIQQLRAAVLRDLAWLLNTTNLAALEDLSGVPRAAKSTINFGIPGFTGLTETSHRFSTLESAIAEAIRTFEPRIRAETLRVKLRPSDDDHLSTTLTFEIHGELWAQPVPQQVFFETAVELETRLTLVAESRGRS